MNMPSKKIRDEFLKFEPYVPENDIEKGWERVRYFLPQEKKRRGLFFFVTRGFVFSTGFALLFFVLLQVNKLWLKDNLVKEEKLISVEEGKKELPMVKSINAENHNRVDKSTKQSKKNPGEALQNIKTIENNDTTRATKTPNAITKTINSFDIVKEESHTNVIQSEKISNIKNSLTDDSLDSDIRYEKLAPVLVNYIELPPREDSVSLLVTFIKRNPALQAVPSKFSFEIFGGLSRSANYINDGYLGTRLKQNTSTYDFGFAFLYKFRKRWLVMADAIYNQYKLDYQSETYGNKVISKNPSPYLTFQGAWVYDTIVIYVPVSLTSRLQSKSNYFIDLGLGYSLIEKNRFFLDFFAQMGLRSTKYIFTRNNYAPAGDTTKFWKSGNSVFPDQVDDSDQEQKKQYQISTLGLNATCVLGYRLNNYLSFIIRPSCFLQMSSDKINTDAKHFVLSQKNLFLNVGLRVKLK